MIAFWPPFSRRTLIGVAQLLPISLSVERHLQRLTRRLSPYTHSFTCGITFTATADTSLATMASRTPTPDSMGPRDRLPNLFEVLSRRTTAPVDLFSFYIYMRDVQRSVDYLDFWYVGDTRNAPLSGCSSFLGVDRGLTTLG